MRSAGWILDVDPDQTRYISYCGSSTFWGYKYGYPIGRISATFRGYGHGSISFGNCWTKGNTNVYLNNQLIGTAAANQKMAAAKFWYRPGDTLKLEEHNAGIILVNSLELFCEGKKHTFMFCRMRE